MKFSVIIPAYNEGARAAAAAKAVLKHAVGADAEVILAVAGRSDAAVYRGLPVEVKVIVSPRGRARQMNLGAAAATGDVLLFLHADTVLPPGALMAAEQALRPGYHRCGAFRLKLDSENAWLRFVAWTANIRNVFTGTPYGDQAIFIKTALFRALGGYAELPIMEDVDLVRRARLAGGRPVILKDYVVSSARRWEKDGLLAVTLTHHALRLLYFFGVAPEKLAAFRNARGTAGKFSALSGSGAGRAAPDATEAR